MLCKVNQYHVNKAFTLRYLFLHITIGVLICACTDTKNTPKTPSETLLPNTKTFVYHCNETYRFIARMENNNVWIFLLGQTVSLSPITSASGAKYTNGDITFWIKDEEAFLETPQQTYRNCKNDRRAAIWEHAKLNGVDFRATGNEPGWYLEITRGQNILFVSDYGQNRYTFKTPEPETHPTQPQTIYHTQNNQHKLTITLEGRRCQDTMADEVYATTVTITFNEKTYRGCGRALH